MNINFDASAWDDTELIKVWDETMKYYKRVHDIPGGSVQYVYQDVEEEMYVKTATEREDGEIGESDIEITKSDHSRKRKRKAKGNATKYQTIEEGEELEEGEEHEEGEADESEEQEENQDMMDNMDGGLVYPDEDLHNAMMSWYNSGYYTGYYMAKKEFGQK